MSRAALAEKKQLERFGNARSPLEATDPDFAEMRDRLIWGEVAWHGSLDAKMQELITLVVLTASQTLDGFAPHVGAALQVGATPEEIKEAISVFPRPKKRSGWSMRSSGKNASRCPWPRRRR